MVKYIYIKKNSGYIFLYFSPFFTRFFPQHWKTELAAMNLPINTLVIVLAIEELYLLKGLWGWVIGNNGWVHGQEGIQSSGARFLWAYHQKLG